VQNGKSLLRIMGVGVEWLTNRGCDSLRMDGRIE
jgi:hypothetical protein